MSGQPGKSLAELESVIERGMSDLGSVNFGDSTGQLTPDAARFLTDRVKADAASLWTRLFDLYNGGAHVALGYPSWASYCAVEFEISNGHSYRLLQAARVVAQLPIGSSYPASESQARELARLKEPEAVREVWQQATERHGERVTAADVRQLVDERLQPPLVEPEIIEAVDVGTPIEPLPAPVRFEVVPQPDPVATYLERELASDPEAQRLKLKIHFHRELKHATELMCLKPEAIAAAVDDDLRHDIAYTFKHFRAWMDEVERALPRGLRVIG